jgi:hypothetical protein
VSVLYGGGAVATTEMKDCAREQNGWREQKGRREGLLNEEDEHAFLFVFILLWFL